MKWYSPKMLFHSEGSGWKLSNKNLIFLSVKDCLKPYKPSASPRYDALVFSQNSLLLTFVIIKTDEEKWGIHKSAKPSITIPVFFLVSDVQLNLFKLLVCWNLFEFKFD